MDPLICDRSAGVNDDEKSTLGDCCQKHNPATVPAVYPYRITKDYARDGTESLRCEYRCACGNDWSCWWNAVYAGWTDEDVEFLNLTAGLEGAA